MTRMILTNAQWELMEPHCLGKDICVMGGNLEFSGIWSFVLVR